MRHEETLHFVGGQSQEIRTPSGYDDDPVVIVDEENLFQRHHHQN